MSFLQVESLGTQDIHVGLHTGYVFTLPPFGATYNYWVNIILAQCHINCDILGHTCSNQGVLYETKGVLLLLIRNQ